MGDEIIRALLQMATLSERLGNQAVRLALARVAEAAASLNLAGLLALVEATLVRLDGGLLAVTRRVADLTRRVQAPGGQTALFPPLN